MRLLIADDEMFIRKGLLSLDWESIGITEVVSAENGLEAKEIIREGNIDILLSDIRMPGVTGLEIAEYIHQYSIDTAVVLLTGFSEFEYAKQAIHYSVYDYILKPLRQKDILDTVAGAIMRLEQKRYQTKVVRQHEETVGASETIEQIEKCFPRINQHARAMISEIGKAYDKDITLPYLADKYHFTSTYISRLIKKETEYSFSDILVGVRLFAASKMLEEGDEKIGMICEKTGFRDQRYFSQVFKRVFSCTPGEYKKYPKIVTLKEILDVLAKETRGNG